jgi:hypothetical protein
MLSGRDSLGPVLGWLGLPDASVASLSSEIVKANMQKQSDLISNFDAVARLLRRTPYASFVQS